MAPQPDWVKDEIVKTSREVADRIIESGLMTSSKWDRREFIVAKQSILDRTSRIGRCESVEDGMDGYFKHDPRCIHWPEGAIGDARHHALQRLRRVDVVGQVAHR